MELRTLLIISLSIAAFLLLRAYLAQKAVKSAQRAAFYREYARILNDPQHKVKSNYD